MECNRARTRAKREAPEYRQHDLETSRQWKRDNRDATRAQVAQYRSENRAKLLSQRVASEQKRRLALNGVQSENVAAVIGEALAAYRIGNLYLDVYSGQLIAKPTVDHIIPISTGGKHEAENLCVTSFENNRSKRATPLIVWMARRAAQCQST